MEILRKVAAFVFAMSTTLAPAFGGTTNTKVSLENLVTISEDLEEPVQESFFEMGDRQRVYFIGLRPIAIDREQPVRDLNLRTDLPRDIKRQVLELRLGQLTTVAQEPEEAVDEDWMIKN